jgi:hypothetical protein
VFVSMFTRLCNHHHYLIPEYSKWNLELIKKSFLFFFLLLWQPLICSQSAVCLLWTNHLNGIIQYVPSVSGFYTWHNIFKVCPSCKHVLEFHSFLSSSNFPSYIYAIVYTFISWCIFELLLLFGYYAQCSYEHSCIIFLYESVQFSGAQ